MLRAPFSFAAVLFACVASCLFLSSCDGGGEKSAPAIGTAWAGPATLKIRADIDPKSTIVATVHHGDKLEIVSQRRRWYKVRTAKKIEGWTTDRELLDATQIQRLRALEQSTKGLPSQGAGTTFGTLNVHSEPSRQAVSFLQIQPQERFDIIAHRVLERTPLPKHELIPPRPKLTKKREPKKGSIPPPPAPVPPGPPDDWLTLSHGREPDPEEVAAEEKAIPHDDWTLIRLPDGESGWVLTSAIYLEIPDEVAQYAEGKRITSYFSLGKVHDGDLVKDIWLWTTALTLDEDHDFDSYRVFVWSTNHHRYETAYIQRRERGFFPTIVKGRDFSVCLEQDDGSRIRQNYQLVGNRVMATGTEPCQKYAEEEGNPDDLAATPDSVAAKQNPGVVARVEAKIKSLLKR